MSRVVVRDLSPREQAPGLSLISRAMRDNPLHVAVFGSASERRERGVLALLDGLGTILPQRLLGAWEGETLVGAAGLAEPGGCRPGLVSLVRAVPRLAHRLPDASRTLPPAIRWLSAWHRADRRHPPHWHVAPFGVEPGRQGVGVGSQLLTACCRRIDDDAASAYLETDSEESVRLFERFGFRTVAELKLLRRPTWLMWRETQS